MGRLLRHWPSGACLLLLCLGACVRTQPPSGQALLEHARQLLRHEETQQALSEAQRGIASAPTGSKLAWDFRLLQVESLLARREAKQALVALGPVSPAGKDVIEEAARYRFCQGYAASLLNDNRTAHLKLNEAEALALSSHTDGRLLAEIELRRAYLAISTRDPVQAKQLLRKVNNYAESYRDDSLRINATGNLGYLELRSAQYDKAVPWFEQTLARAKAFGAKTSEARALGNLGSCYFRLGDLDKAQAYFEQAESQFTAASNRFERQIWLGNIGNIEFSKSEYNPAAAHYKQALAISRQLGSEFWIATWLNNLAVVSIERRDWDAAQGYNEEALSYKKKFQDGTGVAYSLVNAGRIAGGRRQYAQAEENFRSVLRHPPEDLTPVFDAHAGLAETWAQQGRDRDAEVEFQAATDLVARRQAALPDERDKLTWFSGLIRLYREYVDFLMLRGRSLSALELVQSSRLRVLAAQVVAKPSLPHPSARDLQRMAARSESTLLVYWIGTRKSFAWTITGSGIRNFELPTEAELRPLLSRYSRFIQQFHDPVSEAVPAGETLYEKLVAPAKITSGKVFISPDGPLYSLNFATLPVKTGALPHYWIEDVQISVVPSFELAVPARPPEKPSLLLIGNPVAAESEFPELPFAGEEMSRIQQSLPGVRQVVRVRKEASPKAYNQSHPGDFSWIHFVAHATANEFEPLQSAVILSRDTDDAHRLSVRDILQVPIRADLVTVSACRSAGSRIYAGEGLVGFSWGFLSSGARSVITGLWDVNDRSTALLMGTLYGELGKDNRPAAALRAAQLSMLHSNTVFRKPYYWGPFEIFAGGVERSR